MTDTNCIDVPLPTLDTLIALGNRLKNIVPPVILPMHGFPPGLPSPLFASLHMPNFEMPELMLHMQQMQIMTTIKAIIKPMLDLFNIDLSTFLPKIPGFPTLNLMDLISGAWTSISTAIKDMLNKGISIPGIPLPIHIGLGSISLQSWQIYQQIISNYLTTVANMIPALIKRVTDYFHIGIPTFPVLPTLESLKAILLALIPGGITWPDISIYLKKMNMSIGDWFASLALPGLDMLPKMPTLPNPLFGNIHTPNLEFNFMFAGFNSNLITGLLSKVMDFINSTLNRVLTFTFPTLCAPLS